jgi:hypothetical protein
MLLRLPNMRHVIFATALLVLGVARVAAGPEGGAVVGGAATVSGQGSDAVGAEETAPESSSNSPPARLWRPPK